MINSWIKLKKIVGGVHDPEFANRHASFEPNLLTNRTLLEFCQQWSVDKH